MNYLNIAHSRSEALSSIIINNFISPIVNLFSAYRMSEDFMDDLLYILYFPSRLLMIPAVLSLSIFGLPLAILSGKLDEIFRFLMDIVKLIVASVITILSLPINISSLIIRSAITIGLSGINTILSLFDKKSEQQNNQLSITKCFDILHQRMNSSRPDIKTNITHLLKGSLPDDLFNILMVPSRLFKEAALMSLNIISLPLAILSGNLSQVISDMTSLTLFAIQDIAILPVQIIVMLVHSVNTVGLAILDTVQSVLNAIHSSIDKKPAQEQKPNFSFN